MTIKENLKYTKDHEWVRVDGDVAYIGVSDFAQHELGDVVFVECNTVGENLAKEEVFGIIEEVLEFNEALETNPELINSDPYGEGWIVKIAPANMGELDSLLDSTAYKAHIGL
jgi:glycine cleavage system H protein